MGWMGWRDENGWVVWWCWWWGVSRYKINRRYAPSVCMRGVVYLALLSDSMHAMRRLVLGITVRICWIIFVRCIWAGVGHISGTRK